MSVIKWDPFKNISTLQERINRLFDESFSQSHDTDGEEASICGWKPVADIYETEGMFIINVELPGLTKDNLEVEVQDNRLIIKGERPTDKNVSEECYFRRERCFGTFQRTFTLKEYINPDHVHAAFKDGVLTVKVTLPEPEKPKKVTVEVE